MRKISKNNKPIRPCAPFSLSSRSPLLSSPPLSPLQFRQMDEREFRRLLDVFPVVRSRSFCAEAGSSSGISNQKEIKQAETGSSSGISYQKEIKQAETGFSSETAYQKETKTREIQKETKTSTEANFWEKLKSTAERKVGSAKAEQFVKAFRAAHETLVYKELSLDTAQSFLNSTGN